MAQQLFGRYEYVSIPEMAITRLPATLETTFDNSFLSVSRPLVISRNSHARLQFSLLSTDGEQCHTLRLTGARDMRWPGGRRERIYRSAVTVMLGQQMQRVELWLTTERLRSTDLVLGRGHLPQDSEVCWEAAFTQGVGRAPLHQLMHSA